MPLTIFPLKLIEKLIYKSLDIFQKFDCFSKFHQYVWSSKHFSQLSGLLETPEIYLMKVLLGDFLIFLVKIYV